MSGFTAQWLALREPADHAAVNPILRARLREHFCTYEHIAVVDLGCGTGSNLASLHRDLPRRQNWLLVDHDPELLAHARNRAGEMYGRHHQISVATKSADLADGAIEKLIAGADLVTAAALFDLVSEAVIQRMAAAVAAHTATFYTTLTYDGIATWQPPHPLDSVMRAAFNRHQTNDKGFGPAAGPNATDALAQAFERHGYRVRRAPSPWLLDDGQAALRREVDRGWAAAVRETGTVDDTAIDGWLAFRDKAHQAQADAYTSTIGHEDLLALPPS